MLSSGDARMAENNIRGLILHSPLFTLERPYSHYNSSSQSLVTRVLATLFPAWPLSGRYDINLAADQALSEDLQCDKMRYHGRMRGGTVNHISDCMKEVSRRTSELKVSEHVSLAISLSSFVPTSPPAHQPPSHFHTTPLPLHSHSHTTKFP